MLSFCSASTICTSFCLLSTALLILHVDAFAGQPQSSKNPVKVLVTGASGKTGRIVLSKLEKDHRYEPKGLFRTERSARNIVKNDDTLCPLEHVVVADVTSSTFLKDLCEGKSRDQRHADNDSIGGSSKSKSNGLDNMEAMIICTSAVPRIRKRSLAAMLVKAPWRALRGEPMVDIHSMRFAWKHGGYPEKVDYWGQIAQIDLAKKLGIPHVILVSSMGGTNPHNFINSVGKTTTRTKEKKGHGDILLWKRRAEKYLVESGLDYTILHPGHLVDAPGGREEFLFGVDDELYERNPQKNTTPGKKRAATRISREDVAELCVAALSAGKGKKSSFDCITVSPTANSSVPPSMIPNSTTSGADAKANDFTATETHTSTSTTEISTATISTLSDTILSNRKPAEEVLNDFLDLSKSTNYDLSP